MEYHLPLVLILKIFRKELNEQGYFALQFDRLVSQLMKLNHPHILQIGESGVIAGHKYMTIQYREGQSLKESLRDGPLELLIARNVISQVGDALDHAHQHGFIHRNINPNNIWVGWDGQCWLMNFEDVRIFDMLGPSDQIGPFHENPMYYSPEQCLGEPLDGRSDIYSLGFILYEMLTGIMPYKVDSPVLSIAKKIKGDPPLPSEYGSEVSEELEVVILKALARERENRYRTAAEMVAAVKAAMVD
jgi:serine/threonine-protein kinase